jgi:putative intracellular protease/amidase
MQILLIVMILVIVGMLVYTGAPKLLNLMGLHAHYRGRRFDLSGKKALLITTSHGDLGDTGRKTGVWASEMTVPYYQFLDANMGVDIASIKGGDIPIEPGSLRWPLLTPSDKRFLADQDFQRKVKHSRWIDDVDFTAYDLVFIAGGWGAAYDLGTSDVLGRKVSQAYAAGAVLGSVCHGALGFLNATSDDNRPLLEGRRATGVTNKQIKELRISITPQHPETELRKAGAVYKYKNAFLDTFSNLTIVDGRLVSGQNQNAGAETAQRMMELVEDLK